METVIYIDNLALNTGYNISNVSLSLSQSLIIVGRSGSGKTEFCLQILNQNRYLVNSFKDEKMWDQIGYIPTDPNLLFSGMKSTLRGEIELSFQFLGRKIHSVDEIANIYDVIDLLDRNPFTLSGGEAVKAALAIVGAKHPTIWILDQIFDWLQPKIREKIRQNIRRNNINSILIETHCSVPKWIDEFEYCIFLDQDKKSKIGNFKSILPSLKDHFLLGADYEFRKSNYLDSNLDKDNSKEEIFNDTVLFPKSLKNKLKIEEITFRYEKQGFAIGPISLLAKSGDIITLIGPNGAGKTTVLKCLALLLFPDRGNIIINGKKVQSKPYQRAKEILYCFQNPDDQIFLPTVKEELLITLKNLCIQKKTLDMKLLENFDLHDKLEIDPFVLPRAYKKMLTLAASLLVSPPVLLLDEPTAGLDGFQKSQLAEQLQLYAINGGICLIVSHDYDFVKYIANINLYLESGKVSQNNAFFSQFVRGD
jgi:energy-coupling factor transport system ATP-binding protein